MDRFKRDFVEATFDQLTRSHRSGWLQPHLCPEGGITGSGFRPTRIEPTGQVGMAACKTVFRD